MSLKIEKRIKPIGLFFHEPENRKANQAHWAVFNLIRYSFFL
ncbi:hypothetical protein STRINF_02012 [Streptococcus infantarius subsp. infantarius ATCC BAA-102]|uniref:Transposase n=1 Tax=Streptococcus infantarius subsp. infantarius ATCC BAA-102 TaxID=471872 RepID=A0ABM9XCL3_9STRE|nr:hypothetical protein STRINF_02012 [Streptococcus infantarius subsp. infantarius ATCC BAA-102]